MSKPRYPSENLDQYMLRLPDGMRDKIKAAAGSNNRSMNSEIIARLDASFSASSDGETYNNSLIIDVLQASVKQAVKQAITEGILVGERLLPDTTAPDVLARMLAEALLDPKGSSPVSPTVKEALKSVSPQDLAESLRRALDQKEPRRLVSKQTLDR